MPSPTGIETGDKGMTAIKKPETNNRPSARIGGGMSGGITTHGEKEA